jgi:hypothetical protein
MTLKIFIFANLCGVVPGAGSVRSEYRPPTLLERNKQWFQTEYRDVMNLDLDPNPLQNTKSIRCVCSCYELSNKLAH